MYHFLYESTLLDWNSLLLSIIWCVSKWQIQRISSLYITFAHFSLSHNRCSFAQCFLFYSIFFELMVFIFAEMHLFRLLRLYFSLYEFNPANWDSRIHWLHICRCVRTPNWSHSFAMSGDPKCQMMGSWWTRWSWVLRDHQLQHSTLVITWAIWVIREAQLDHSSSCQTLIH